MTSEERYRCPCCGTETLTERGHYEICTVCNWEDDPIQAEQPDYEGGANTMSLNDARRDFRRKKESN